MLVFGDGLEMTNYYGVSVSRGRPLAADLGRTGTAPRNDLWVADLAASAPERPDCVIVQEGVDAQTGAARRPRRPALRLHRPGRAAGPALRDRPGARPAPSSWRDLMPEDAEAVLSDFAILDGAELAPVCWSAGPGTRSARSPCTTWRPASGSGEVPLPGLRHRSAGIVRAARGRPRGLVRLHRQHHPGRVSSTTTRAPARPRLWAAPPGAVEVPTVRTEQVDYRSKDGTEVRMLVIAPAAGRTGPAARRSCTATAASASRMTPATPRRSWPGSRRAASTRSPACAAAARRARTGTGPACSRTSRTSSTTSTPRPSTSSPAAGPRPSSSASPAAPTAACWSARPSPSGPTCTRAVVCSAPLLDMVRYERFGLGATWNDEYGTADDPERVRLAARLLALPPGARGTSLPGDAVHRLRRRHPGRPAARAARCARRCSTPLRRPTGRSCCATRREVGHGARAVSRSVDLSADTLTFLAKHLGL